jgi:N-acetylglucosamine-6-phosphate deacetylase
MGMGGVQGKSLVQVLQLWIGPAVVAGKIFRLFPSNQYHKHLAMGFISGYTHGFKDHQWAHTWVQGTIKTLADTRVQGVTRALCTSISLNQ